MIVPWLQVAEEAFERAVELAALMGIGEAQAMGHLVWLWRGALSRPADAELTGIVRGPRAVVQIEAWARWQGERGALAAALVELGLLVPDDSDHRVCGLDRYRSMLDKRAKDRERQANLRESVPRKESPRPRSDSQRVTGSELELELELEKQLPLSAEKPADRADMVFEHWRRVMGKNARTAFDQKRRKAVEARLADGYTVEDLFRAVYGCALTPHNMGQNDRNERFDDLELICRDAAHVDRFKATAVARTPAVPARDDREVLREVAAYVLTEFPGASYIASHLDELKWSRDGEKFVGVCEDQFRVAWFREHLDAERLEFRRSA